MGKAWYKTNPLEDGSLKGYKLFRVPINVLNREAVSEVKLSPREADRCKNFFALGLVYWLYERPLEPTKAWIRARFDRKPDVYRACERAHRRLMRLHYLSGDRTGALRQYAQCVSALDEELGVKPAQRTQVLYDQIRADCLIETIPAPRGGDPVTDGVARLQSVRSTLTDLHRQILHDIQTIDHALHGLN